MKRVWLTMTAVATTALAFPAFAHDGEPGHTHDDDEKPAVAPPAIDYAPPEEDDADYTVPPDDKASTKKAGDKGAEGVRGDTASSDEPAETASRDPGAGAEWRPQTIDDTTWRRAAYEKDERERKAEEGMEVFEPSHILFELRFGPYSPEVDEDGGVGGAYEKYFGTDPLFYFGMELDWLPLHIPYVGSIGPGFGWGWTEATGSARTVATDEPTDAETQLTIFPMHVSAVLRIDGPIRKWNVPIIPYAKIGLGFAVWQASDPSKDADGTSAGMHLALGGALALNTFDKEAALRMREATGIRYASLYGEWMWMNLDGLGGDPVLHVGTSTVVLGLSLDF